MIVNHPDFSQRAYHRPSSFFTSEALRNIARTTLDNISHFEKTGECQNEVTRALLR
jgi:lactate dehydrogenase-like 2-hydroxyacid dehydrogenase